MLNENTRSLLDPLLRSERAVAVFSDVKTLQAMLDFEAGLAKSEEKLGIIPVNTASAIASCCYASRFDLRMLSTSAVAGGNLAIPMIRQLTSLVKERSADAAGFVHWGATSQDAIDTGCVLQLREHFRMLRSSLWAIAGELARLTTRHANTVMAGRTWLQHAVPITFGLKTAGCLDALLRHIDRLEEALTRILAVQLGGAAGTLASLGKRGTEVSAALAAELNLELAPAPWHGSADRLAEASTIQGLLVGTLGKIARDLSLLGQTEIGEAREQGAGSSSTMPHKKNPVALASVLSAAIRVPGLVGTMLSAMAQEHERGLGGWQVGWETLPEICMLTLGAAEKMNVVLANLDVDADRMLANLGFTSGLVMAEAVSMALAESIGRDKAHSLLENVSKRAIAAQTSLRDQLACEEQVTQHLSPEELDKLFETQRYLGSTQQIIGSVMLRYESRLAREQRFEVLVAADRA